MIQVKCLVNFSHFSDRHEIRRNGTEKLIASQVHFAQLPRVIRERRQWARQSLPGDVDILQFWESFNLLWEKTVEAVVGKVSVKVNLGE